MQDGGHGERTSSASDQDDDTTPSAKDKGERADPRPDHGRHRGDAYRAAEKVRGPHESLRSADLRPMLHRKNALFYKTLNGAHVGDLFMSLIHTCQLNHVNPFEYLTELQRYAADLAAQPENWMPWNYRDTLAGTAAPHEAPR